jgi:hypothetical protein
MILRAVLALTLPFAAATASAEGLSLSVPIDCDLTETCYIQQYVDRDPGPGATDYQCAGLTYDGHKGTDFALPTRAVMAEGVAVLAAAPGRVTGLRDGMEDTGLTSATAGEIEGRECGNGVVIAHRDGWETQYCHMRKGSVTVVEGQDVERGEVLGLVGQSGRAQFPHVHLSLRRNGEVVDPFDRTDQLSCDAEKQPMWQVPPDYRPGGVLDIGFADRVPEYDTIKAGKVAQDALTVMSPALVVYGLTFGTQAGDILRLKIEGPAATVIEDDVELTKPQAQSFRAIGRRRKAATWPAGTYTGSAKLLRDGAVVQERSAEITLQ